MAELLDGGYKKAQNVIVMCDILNAYTKGAFCELFSPAKVKDARRKLKSLYPKIKT